MLTVVIPVYNEEDILKSQLELMLNDLDRMEISHELRVVENGSDDATWEKLNQVADRYPRRVYPERIDRANLGLARKHGIDQAAGNFVYISDLDYWLPEFIKQAWALREQHEVILGIKQDDERNIVRRTMKRGKNLCFQSMFGVQFTDMTQIIFTRADLARQYMEQCSSTHAVTVLEFLIRLQWAGHEVEERTVNQKSEIRPPRLSYMEKFWYAIKEFLHLTWIIYGPK